MPQPLIPLKPSSNGGRSRVASEQLYLKEESLHDGVAILALAADRLDATLIPKLEQHRLSRTQFRMLSLIRYRREIAVAELRAMLPLTPQSLSRNLRGLDGAGLVVMRPSHKDRRQKILNLSEKGARLEAELSQCQGRALAQAWKHCRADEVASFRKILELISTLETPF